MSARTQRDLDVTVVLPCLNEEATVFGCVASAERWITARGLGGEVLVVDNGSTDASGAVAASAGARVIVEGRRGYGRALHRGIGAARGRVLVIADADGTYDLDDLDAFYDPIAEGSADVVIGNRFATVPTAAAMTRLHRLGNRLLSAAARGASGTDVADVHCGLRAFSAQALADLPAWSTGMEFATHTVLHAHRAGLRIAQQPTILRPSPAVRRSHLNPLRDGVRHLVAIARQTKGGSRRGRARRQIPPTRRGAPSSAGPRP